MAERSFAREVAQLRLRAGEEFRGEGIVAITKALLQCGVGYVAGYQGAPISHLMDVLADAREILEELGVHFESSASEAAAAATLAASVMYPIRGAVAWKSTAGTNVAADALSNLASSGVNGGALIVVGEDYGEGSSIMQERSHAFAMKSQIWLLDPRPNLPSIVSSVEAGFELSEASATPVMLEVRIRACHLHGRFIARDNRRPSFPLAEARANPQRDTGRIVLPPASFAHEQDKIARRWPAAVRFIRERQLNEHFPVSGAEAGIILQGGMFNGVVRALQVLGLADGLGRPQIPLLVLNVTYPLVEEEITEFCRDKRAVLVAEEGQPNFIQQAIQSVLAQSGLSTRVHGKDVLPMAGEYTTSVLVEGIRGFVGRAVPPHMRPNLRSPPDPGPVLAQESVRALADIVPSRPPGFCTGCPERPIFAAMKLVERELGAHHVAADIGCHLFSILPPFNIGATTMGYGLGPASASAFGAKSGRRTISIMGDGGFWHNGLTSSIGNAVFNKSDGVILIVDNHYAAATGGQDLPSSRAASLARSTRHPIAEAVRGVGVGWVREIDDTYDVSRMRDTLREALGTSEDGPKVIIASSECMLNRQRRLAPVRREALARGRRVVQERFGVDEDVCNGDHACVRLSGCPSLSLKPSSDPFKEDPVAAIDQDCVGCGNCGEVADAAILCPSFYRLTAIRNPGRWERLRGWFRACVMELVWRASRRRPHTGPA
ncbi:MAG: indolepyruvate ferredoxin oxidoreductase subunit alpha [Alphaproteobacteria bacterium]|nr:indolepyruvate ferredoxin oxidoreductase subunit alpha [Alphaproteobacteria bacterium]